MATNACSRNTGLNAVCGLILIALGCWSTFCSSDHSQTATTAADSADVTIVTVTADPSQVARWHLRRQYMLAEQGTGRRPLFEDVTDVVSLASGELVVADGQARTLHLFDSAGFHLSSYGRRGEGPGEFMRLGRVSAVEDSIFVYDRVRRMLQVFHPDAGFVRSASGFSGTPAESPLDVWPMSNSRFVRYSHRYDSFVGPDNSGIVRRSATAVLTLVDGNGTPLAAPVEFRRSLYGNGVRGRSQGPILKCARRARYAGPRVLQFRSVVPCVAPGHDISPYP